MTRADAATKSTEPAKRARIGLIWAQAAGVIGRDGGMPWHVPEDLAHFKSVTGGAPVVMGRRTWESLPPRFRPLPGRQNIVVTRQRQWAADGAQVAASIDEALALAAGGRVWVIGGAELFASVISIADRLEVTELVHPAGFEVESGDVLAPEFDPDEFHLVSSDPSSGEHTSRNGIRYRFLTFAREGPPRSIPVCSTHSNR